MSELHLLVVYDTETRTYRTAGLNEAPVDSDESVWDGEAEEWREPTFAETIDYDNAYLALSTALDQLAPTHAIDCDLGEDCSCGAGILETTEATR